MSKPDYTKLAAAIVAAIKAGHSPLYANAVAAIASAIEVQTKRHSFRIIDGRLQVLRKSGVIWHAAKGVAADGKAGWHMNEDRS